MGKENGAGMTTNTERALRQELCDHLDSLNITSENIGEVRRSLFLPFQTSWNGLVRDETAKRENATLMRLADPATLDSMYVHVGALNARLTEIERMVRDIHKRIA